MIGCMAMAGSIVQATAQFCTRNLSQIQCCCRLNGTVSLNMLGGCLGTMLLQPLLLSDVSNAVMLYGGAV